jgi:hypothetical protein
MVLVSKHQEGHTLCIMEQGLTYYITLLKNLKGFPKNFREYRITHLDGLVKYMTIEEFKSTPFERFTKECESLNKRVDESKIKLLNNRLIFA